jgi:hypothetical protein
LWRCPASACRPTTPASAPTPRVCARERGPLLHRYAICLDHQGMYGASGRSSGARRAARRYVWGDRADAAVEQRALALDLGHAVSIWRTPAGLAVARGPSGSSGAAQPAGPDEWD